MKARLVALALALSAVVGGGIFFFNWDTAQIDDKPINFGEFEVVDRSLCDMSNCTANACDVARNHLADAGITDATLRFIECPVRVGQSLRNKAADAGLILGPAKYQQIRLIAMRRNGAMGIPVDDNGWPINAVAVATFPCAWRPAGAVRATCLRIDGGEPGDENTMQPGDWVGAGCVRKSCAEIAGESSAP